MYLVQAILERIAARLRLKIELQLRQSPEYQVMPANRLRAVIENDFSRRYRRMDQMDQLLQTFGFIWFVIGSVWVFGCSECKSDFDEDLNTVRESPSPPASPLRVCTSHQDLPQRLMPYLPG